MRGGHGNRVVSVAAGVLAASGVIAVALALAAQEHAPQPPLSAAGSPGPTTVSAGAPVLAPSPPISPGTTPISPVPTTVFVGVPVLSPSPPLAIDIPAIGVQSELQYLGLTAQQTLEVPVPGPHYDHAAWYKYSSTPGSVGPAVILGHVDSVTGGPSVFFNLGALQPGDEVLVTRADGLVAVFSVDKVARYPKEQFPTLLVYGNTDHAALRLITCGGDYDRATGSYLDNIIVFASLVGSR